MTLEWFTFLFGTLPLERKLLVRFSEVLSWNGPRYAILFFAGFDCRIEKQIGNLRIKRSGKL